MDIPKDEELWRASDSDPNERNELGLRRELINHNELRSRLQYLQIELSSVLQAVRSNADESASQKVVTGSLPLVCNFQLCLHSK